MKSGLLWIAVTAVGSVCAQDEGLRERYLAILERRPEPGTVFDRLYASWRDREGVDAFELDLRATLAREPQRFALGVVLGLVLERRGDADAALAVFDGLLARRSELLAARRGRARTLERLGRHREAIEAYRSIIALELSESEREGLEHALSELLVRHGALDEARALFEDRLTRRPEDRFLRVAFVELLIRHDALEEALAQLDRLASAAEGDPEWRARHALEGARLAIVLGRLESLGARVTALLEDLRPGSWLRDELHATLRETAWSHGVLAELLAIYAAWLERRPDDLDAMRAVARIERRRADDDAAAGWLERVLERQPRDHATREELANLLERRGDVPTAIEHVRRAIELGDDRIERHERLGALWLAEASLSVAERRRRAIAAWERSFASAPDDPHRILRAADLARAHGLHDAAEAWFRRAAERAADPVPFRFAWGAHLLDRGRIPEALSVLRAVLVQDAECAATALRITRMLEDGRHPQHALAVAEEGWRLARTVRGVDPAAVFALGEALVARLQASGRHDEAGRVVDELEERIDPDPSRRRALAYLRLQNLRQRGALDQEAREVERRVRLGTARADRSLLWLAQVHLERGALEEAAEAVGRAHDRDPHRADGWLLLANVEERRRRAGAAFAALECAAKAEPERAVEIEDARLRIARRFRRHDVAIRAVGRLLDLRPSDEATYLTASEVHVDAGDEEAALAILARGLRHVYGRAALRERKVQLHRKRGEWRAARDEVAALFEEERSVEPRLEHARTWVDLYANGPDVDSTAARIAAFLVTNVPREDPATVLARLEFHLPAEHARPAVSLLRELVRRGAAEPPLRPFACALLERHLQLGDATYLQRELLALLDQRDGWGTLAVLLRTGWPQRLPEAPRAWEAVPCLLRRCLVFLRGAGAIDELRARLDAASPASSPGRWFASRARVALLFDGPVSTSERAFLDDALPALARVPPNAGSDEREVHHAWQETVCHAFGARRELRRHALAAADSVYARTAGAPARWAERAFAIGVLALDDRPFGRRSFDELSGALRALPGISRTGHSAWPAAERLEACAPVLESVVAGGGWEFALRHLLVEHREASSDLRTIVFERLVLLAERARDAGVLDLVRRACRVATSSPTPDDDAYDLLLGVLGGDVEDAGRTVERLLRLDPSTRQRLHWIPEVLTRAERWSDAFRWIAGELAEGRIEFAREITRPTLEALFRGALEDAVELERLVIRLERQGSEGRAARAWTSHAIARARMERVREGSGAPSPRVLRACHELHRLADRDLAALAVERDGEPNRPHLRWRLEALVALGREREARRELERALFRATQDGTTVPDEATLFEPLPSTGRGLVALLEDGARSTLRARLRRLRDEHPQHEMLVDRLLATLRP